MYRGPQSLRGHEGEQPVEAGETAHADGVAEEGEGSNAENFAASRVEPSAGSVHVRRATRVRLSKNSRASRPVKLTECASVGEKTGIGAETLWYELCQSCTRPREEGVALLLDVVGDDAERLLLPDAQNRRC